MDFSVKFMEGFMGPLSLQPSMNNPEEINLLNQKLMSDGGTQRAQEGQITDEMRATQTELKNLQNLDNKIMEDLKNATTLKDVTIYSRLIVDKIIQYEKGLLEIDKQLLEIGLKGGDPKLETKLQIEKSEITNNLEVLNKNLDAVSQILKQRFT